MTQLVLCQPRKYPDVPRAGSGQTAFQISPGLCRQCSTLGILHSFSLILSPNSRAVTKPRRLDLLNSGLCHPTSAVPLMPSTILEPIASWLLSSQQWLWPFHRPPAQPQGGFSGWPHHGGPSSLFLHTHSSLQPPPSPRSVSSSPISSPRTKCSLLLLCQCRLSKPHDGALCTSPKYF